MPRVLDVRDLNCSWRLEERAFRRGFRVVAGTDEVGRGALLGPLYAAAVILDKARPVIGANDSKKLTAQQRLSLSREIRKNALAYKVVAVPAWEVDALNVYEASRQAMIRALLALMPQPEFILTDAMSLRGNGRYPGIEIPYWPIVKGDARSVSVAAASILAKVARDANLEELDLRYPEYHLAHNKGYGTREHLEALRRYGPCPEHRRTYQPVKDRLLPRLPFGSP
jgi:ribonuclease HII